MAHFFQNCFVSKMMPGSKGLREDEKKIIIPTQPFLFPLHLIHVFAAKSELQQNNVKQVKDNFRGAKQN
jgi:hypothetical protein